ncbi:MAG: glutamate racemase [bacterium]|nr:glutamate racemase [bacterium]
MKIGIFDSGLGGLIIMRRIVELLPQYDYVYLGDAQRVPYGTRSQKTVYEFTKQGVDFLFRKGCKIVILACNTASANALRRIQREYLPRRFPNRRVLGVVVPTLEAVWEGSARVKNLGVIATIGTVSSQVYPAELAKLHKKLKVFQQSAPLLVPLIEHQGHKYLSLILRDYLRPLLKKKIDGLVLGCTHYPIIKGQIRKFLGTRVHVFSQDEIIPKKLVDYLNRHPEISRKLSKKSRREFYVTDLTPAYKKLAFHWFGEKAVLRLVKI